MARSDPPMDSTRAPLAGDTLRIETPEAVAIEYPLAGLGSRFTALFVDFLWLLLLGAVAPVLVLILLTAFTDDLLTRGMWWALLIVYEFLLLWGYFIWFEAFRDGRTPGKRAVSIRVVMDGGYPVTLRAAAIRNLVRIVDLQPGITCLVGGFFMLTSSQGRRLGDHAAGTVVVRDMPIEFPELRQLPAVAAAPRLSDDAFRALEQFVERRSALEPKARARVAEGLQRKLPASAEPLHEAESVEDWLVRLHDDEAARRQASRLAGAAGSAAATALLHARRQRWTAFRDTVQSTHRTGLAALGEDRLAEFAAQYRDVSADLARARTYGASPATLFALERLVGAAHNLFYRPVRGSARSLDAFVRRGFPRLVRRLWLPITLAACLLYGPALVTYAVLRSHPQHERSLAGVEIIQRAERAAASGGEYIDTIDMPWMGSTAFSSFLIANNVQVSFIAFAGGVLLGLGTLGILVVNGLSLGAALAVFANRDVLGTILLWVAPHGVVELTAIAIAGGAGLWMGSGLLLPGRRTRLASFTARARDAVALVAGVAMLLVVAGLIEAWISPSRLPAAVKLVLAALAALGLLHYLVFAGRRGTAADDAAPGPRTAGAG